MASLLSRPDIRYANALGVSLLSGSLVLLSAGTFYAFSLYGPQLEKRFNYSTSQTAAIAASTNLGVYLTGPIWGLLVDRVNPRWLFLTASALLGSGYALASYAYLGTFGDSIPFLLMCLFFFTVGVGSGGAYHTGLATNLRNWPANFRGLAIGIPVAVFGLCGFICAAVARRFFTYELSIRESIGSLDVPVFLSFLGVQGFIVNFVAAFVLKDVRHLRPGMISIEPPQSEPQEVEEEVEEPPHDPPVIVSSPVMVDEAENDEEDENVPFITSAGSFRRGWTFPNLDEEAPREDEEVDIPCFFEFDALLLLLIMFAVTGTGLMVVNNIGKVIESLFPPNTPITDPTFQATQSLHVTIFSIAGFLGRLVTGALSDHLSSSTACYVRRATWAPLPSFIMLLGSLLALRVTHIGDLVPVTMVVAIAYGSVWTIVPVLVNEFFGSKRFGFHWGLMTLSPAVAGLTCSMAFGRIFDSHGKPFEGLPADDSECKGPHCFAPAFVFTTGLCAFGLVCGIILACRRSTVLYRMASSS